MSLLDDGVHEIGIAVKLVLDDVVEDLQEEEDQVVVAGVAEEEPGRAEGLQQVEHFGGRHHGQRLQVGADVDEDGEEAVEEWLQARVAGGDQLVEDHHQQVGVRPREDRQVHGRRGQVRPVQADAKVALPAQ